MTRIVLVPGVLALLPEHASLSDPVAELRAACLDAVAWLGPAPRVIADPQGARVAAYLLSGGVSECPREVEPPSTHTSQTEAWLVVGNGSARRTQASPGPYDERAVAFDEELERGLLGPAPELLRGVDQALAGDLWAAATCLPALADLLEGAAVEAVDFAGDPFGVQYWVVRWTR